MTWTAPVSNERPHIDSPAVKAVQLGSHRHTVSGTAAPGHQVQMFVKGHARPAVKDVGSDGHFRFRPFIKNRSPIYVKDLTNGLASNTITIYVKARVVVHCDSPRRHRLVCHLRTDPHVRHTVVDWSYANRRDGSKGTRVGETNRRGRAALHVFRLTRGHYHVRALVHGKHRVRHGVGAGGTFVR